MAIHLSLDKIRLLVAKLPDYTRKTIHIVGTNGKGSCAALLSSILVASSFHVGRFNSPHLITVADSISVDGQTVDTELFNATREKIRSANEGIGASDFEVLTVTALSIFEALKVDLVVLEAGMGGRLDATNVIPDSTVIGTILTSVDLDHQTFLGETVQAIAREKAAVYRTGSPFVVGKQAYDDVIKIVETLVSREDLYHSQPAQRVERHDVSWTSPRAVTVLFRGDTVECQMPLLGQHQLDNLGLTVTILEALSHTQAQIADKVSAQTLMTGVASTRWLGRLSFHEIQRKNRPDLKILADGAHNPASFASLAKFLQATTSSINPKRVTLILGLSASPDKSVTDTLSPIFLSAIPSHCRLRVAAVTFTTPEEMPWVKPVPPMEILTTAINLRPDISALWESPHDWNASRDFDTLLDWIPDDEDIVILTGSLYLVADLYRWQTLIR